LEYQRAVTLRTQTTKEDASNYRALTARDARFDGRLFTGITSTGIYCRPICPARTPKRENCRFFPSAAAAQAAGFRPCLRCRPEVAPHSAAWRGSSTTVQRALRLISGGALDNGDVPQLAACLGIGERQLRRLFEQHLGASPVEVAQTQRLFLAKELIDESSLPMTTVALAAGFRSVRRFNDAVKSSFGRTPSELRRGRHRGAHHDKDHVGHRSTQRAHARTQRNSVRDTIGRAVTVKLPFRPPYNWDAMIDFLTARAIPGVEEVKDGKYRRVIPHPSGAGFLEVGPSEENESARHFLRARVHLPGVEPLLPFIARIRRLFDLDADSETIDAQLARHPRLRTAVRAHPGTRVPGVWNPFELTVRAILGQQISVKAATTLAGRLVQAYGQPARTPYDGTSITHHFPTPARLAAAGTEIRQIGLPEKRAASIGDLARAVANGEVVYERDGIAIDASAALRSIRGIGAWTAQYVALRGAGDPDVMMPGDLGVRRALAAGGELPSEREVLALSQAWRPWRSYAVFALWNSEG
jgi:AraC family transcriptional regulator, regulatory protein of adaptative response / DNA-3-methyladenine glycosylase II